MKNLLLVIVIIVLGIIVLPTSSLAATPASSSASPATNIVPYPTLDITEPVPACETDGTIYPPNSVCYAEVKRTQLKVSDYPKTCIKEPIIKYEDTRGIGGTYGYNNCYDKDGSPCDIYVTVTTDVSQAELGSYGPSYSILQGTNLDSIAKQYLFSSLFDRPYYTSEDTPREAWRSYWRLMPINEQFNLVAQFFSLVNLSNSFDSSTLKKINNTEYQYVDAGGNTQKTTVKELAASLPSCLKREPVCEDFATVYNNLSPDVKAAYDTLIPLSFNNVRGFIALDPLIFPDRTPLLPTVSRESIPYVEAIFSGLLSSKYGLIGNLQPNWLFTKSLSGLTDTNTGYDLTSGKDNYISGQFDGSFGDIKMDPEIIKKADIYTCPEYPNIYTVSAPRTFPKSIGNSDGYHNQEVQLKGSTLSWELQVTGANQEYDEYGNFLGYSCNSPASLCNSSECCQYKVTGIGIGKAITVFNNPKTTDIKESIVSNSKASLYSSLIPNALLVPTPTDKKINAPTSENTVLGTEETGTGTPNNPQNPIFRENNLAQDTIHVLQNCWLVPSDQQSSSKCGGASGCDGPVPNLPINDSSCKVGSNPFSLPEPLIKAIESASSTYKVPAALMIGIMYGEGAFNPGSDFFDAGFVEENLKACAVLPGCDPNGQVYDNIVPFFQAYWGDDKDAVKAIDPNREPNGCNLLDGIFALAQNLHKNQYGSADFSGKTCFGIPLNAGSGASSSCSWDSSDIETAIRVWEIGYGYNSTYTCLTLQNSCLMGGGVSANCSGGDTCETQSNRYPGQPSHNGCIWDVYSNYK